MTSPVLIIGEAPGKGTDPDFPVYPLPAGSAGQRLQAMTGLSRGHFLLHFDRMNLLREYPPLGKWPSALARLSAAAVSSALVGRTVVFLGARVTRAFGHGFEEQDCFQFREHRVIHPQGVPQGTLRARGAYAWASVPHPSGRNPFYNDPGNQRQAEQFWQELVSG